MTPTLTTPAQTTPARRRICTSSTGPVLLPPWQANTGHCCDCELTLAGLPSGLRHLDTCLTCIDEPMACTWHTACTRPDPVHCDQTHHHLT